MEYQIIKMRPVEMAAVPSMQLLLWSTVLSLVRYHVWAQDPCASYNVLSDESRSILKYSSLAASDYQIGTGWYRFMGKAGDKMLDYVPTGTTAISSKYRCGALMPGYLTGQHPKGSEGIVNRKVCIAYSGSNCWTSRTIQVKNCGNYFVYKLQPVYSWSWWWYVRYCGSGEMTNNYPCIHYQLLTEETRVTSYRSKANNFCDRNLNGWYRFWGAAGDRMLEKCPVIADKTVFPCGAYYHGWLNTKNPKPLDGTVNRTVCFSDVVSCQCRSFFSRQIQMRNCGSYFVYNLQGLNDICNGAFGNNARYCGMRDKDAYKVSCSANYMQIELDRRYYNSSKYKSIGMLNPKCGHTLSYDYITLGCIPGACGSIKEETSTKIIYTNAVKLVAKFGNGHISRESDETIYFKCSYNRDAILSISFDPVRDISVVLEKFGNFSFHFKTYRTSAFENPIQSFPVKLKLRDWLYFEVNATVQDSNLALIIERCYSTPTMNPDEPGKYDLIKDKCVVDVATTFVPSTGLRRRFSMQVFKYENPTTVYIHCLIFLCRTNSSDSRCRTGCSGNNIYSRKRRDISQLTDSGNEQYTSFYKLDSGQLLLDAPGSYPNKNDANRQSENGSKDTSVATSTGIAGGMAAVVLILIIIVVVLVLKRRNPPDSRGQQGNEIGLENVGGEINEHPSEAKKEDSITA